MQGREQQSRAQGGQASSLPAAVPVVGRAEQQRLAARAAVGRRVTAVHRRRHRVLLVPCGESSTELTLGARGHPCAGHGAPGAAWGSSGSAPDLRGLGEAPRGFPRGRNEGIT